MEKRVGTKKETLVRASNRSITAKDSKDIKTITEEIAFGDFIVKEFGSSIDIYTNDFPGVHATQSELKTLSDNEMISNVIINVDQQMMARQHLWLKGRQDPSLCQTMPFRRFQSQSFVQIPHDGATHWLAIRAFNSKLSEIMLMESLFKRKVFIYENSKKRKSKLKSQVYSNKQTKCNIIYKLHIT